MRIALITDGIWPYVLGGMQKHSYYVCKYLAQKKVQVDLIHYNRSAYKIDDLEFFTEEEKKYIRPILVDFPQSLAYPGAYLINSYRHSKKVLGAIKAQLGDYDFIYTKGFTGWYLINKKSRKQITCPPVGVKFHGYEMFQKPPGLKALLQQILLLRYPVKKITRRADVVFSYGGKITSIIQSLGVADKNIIEIPSGVERDFVVNEAAPVGEVRKFLFLGRYERRKGIEELSQAIAALLAEKKLAAEFHFIGPVPVEKQQRHSQIIYHGEIRDKEILRSKITACDVLMCPSYSEGMPNSIMEAMACGLAAMATDVGAVNVLVNPKTGWLLPGSQPQSIKACLEEIISLSPSQLLEKKQNALLHIKHNFVWETLIQKLLDSVSNINLVR